MYDYLLRKKISEKKITTQILSVLNLKSNYKRWVEYAIIRYINYIIFRMEFDTKDSTESKNIDFNIG